MSEQRIHKQLEDYNEIVNAVRIINNKINGCGFSFREDSACLQKSFARNYLSDEDKAILVLASFDFSYYHDLEMIFYNVNYTTVGAEYSWWDHWTKDQLELNQEILKDEKGNSLFEFALILEQIGMSSISSGQKNSPIISGMSLIGDLKTLKNASEALH